MLCDKSLILSTVLFNSFLQDRYITRVIKLTSLKEILYQDKEQFIHVHISYNYLFDIDPREVLYDIMILESEINEVWLRTVSLRLTSLFQTLGA